MHNWSVDEKKLSRFPSKHKLWKIEQMINYGLDGEKLKRDVLEKNWEEIKKNLDPYKKRALEYLLWEKLYSLPTSATFSR